MEPTWLDRIHTFAVERAEIPRPGGKPYHASARTLIGVLHTTEGTTVEGALDALRARSVAPHFIAGRNRILQCRPLPAQGSTLRPGPENTCNAQAQIQIEMVARSREKPWLPTRSTLEPTVAIIAYCAKYLAIPLRVPNGWPDDCADMPKPWAGNNARRLRAAKGSWPREKGWWMHLEVPHQAPTWHWDCGALRRTALLAMASALLPRL